MMPVTIAVTVIALVAVLAVRPGWAVGVIVMSMFLWPEYLRIDVGLAKMSAPRLAALALVARLALGRPLPRWRWTDLVVFSGWIWVVAAHLIMGAGQSRLGTMIGAAFDTVLLYAVGRLALRSIDDLRDLLWPMVICCGVMAVDGLMQNITASSPYRALFAYHEWTWRRHETEYRLGLARAIGSTSQPIVFGMAMAFLTGMLYSLRTIARSHWVWMAGLGLGCIATFSSLSSGPFVMLACLVVFNVLYWWPRLIWPGVATVVLAAVALEMVSNRHFYELIDYIGLDSGNSWYRARLIEVVLGHFSEYWAFGMGDRDYSDWGIEINGLPWVDMVNNYLIYAVEGGVMAVLLYLLLKVVLVREAAAGFKRGASFVKPIAFAQGAAFVALSIAEMSVGLFGPVLLLSFLFAGGLVGDWKLQKAVVRAKPVVRAARPGLRPAGVGRASVEGAGGVGA